MRGSARPTWSAPFARPASTPPSCPTGSRPRSPRGAPGYRSGRPVASASPGPCWPTRRSCCSTSRLPPSMGPVRRRSAPPWPRLPHAGGPSWWSPIASHWWSSPMTWWSWPRPRRARGYGVSTPTPLRRLWRLADPDRARLALAALLATLSLACGVGLLAVSAWLISRASRAAADPVPAGRDRLGARVRHLPGRVPLRRAAGRSRRGLPQPDPDPGGRLRAARAAVPRGAGGLPAGRPDGAPRRRRGLLRGPDRARRAPGGLRAPGRRARRRDRCGDPARGGRGPAGHGGRRRGPVTVADRAARRPGAALPRGRRGPVVRPGGHEPVRGPRAARVRRGRGRGGGHRPRGRRADRPRPPLGDRLGARRGPERAGDRADRRGLHRPRA